MKTETLGHAGFELSRWEPEENDELPVPRLQLQWLEIKKDAEGFNWVCNYSLIYRHTLGHLVGIPMGQTRSESSCSPDDPRHNKPGQIDTPFRDGVHIRRDAAELNLPCFVLCGDKHQQLEPIRKVYQAIYRSGETERVLGTYANERLAHLRLEEQISELFLEEDYVSVEEFNEVGHETGEELRVRGCEVQR